MQKHASNRKDKNMDHKTYQPKMPDIMEPYLTQYICCSTS